jgi:hypothetical protein
MFLMSHILSLPVCTHLGRLGCVLAVLACVAVASGCSREPSPERGQGADPAATRLPRSGPAADLRFLTGARTRVVWVQGDGSDPYATGDGLRLMAFDSDDGLGERALLEERGSYVKPLMTPRGDRVIFTTQLTDPGGPRMFIVNWDGSGLRELGPGWALTLWQEPGTGREWIYVGSGATPDRPYDSTTVERAPLDDLRARELVWNKTLVGGDTFQVSADGRLAGGLFPWPRAGVADLPNGELRMLGDGCWPALNTPGAPVFWYFDGAHRNITMVDVEADHRWTVPVNQAPGFDGAEVYHPRWTNHPRFLVISGPYNQGGTNQVRSGGAQSEVYVGRFNDRYTRVDAWVRVTSNDAGDSYPDVWVDTSQSDVAVRAAGPIGPDADAGAEATPAPRTARAASGRVVIEARLTSAPDIPSPRSIAPYRNALVVNGYEVVKVIEGEYAAEQVLVAQWAIKDARVLPRAQQRAVGTVARLTLSPYDAHPELEGERLLAQSGGPDLPIYYDVGSRP